MNIADDMAGEVKEKLDTPVNEQGTRFIRQVEALFQDPRLEDLARTADTDQQHLAAQVACMGVSSAVASFPAPARARRILVTQLISHLGGM